MSIEFVASILLAFVCGVLGFATIWAVANRCTTGTAFALVAGVIFCASTSGILIVEYLRSGGAWHFIVVQWLCFALGLGFFHLLHWFRMEVWTRVQWFWYNLTKKKETK
jgi:hypothetical protein